MPVICPRMSEKMKELAEIYKNDKNIQFLSISVDPANDSKEVIKNYINTKNLNYSNWYFLKLIPQLVDFYQRDFYYQEIICQECILRSLF